MIEEDNSGGGSAGLTGGTTAVLRHDNSDHAQQRCAKMSAGLCKRRTTVIEKYEVEPVPVNCYPDPIDAWKYHGCRKRAARIMY